MGPFEKHTKYFLFNYLKKQQVLQVKKNTAFNKTLFDILNWVFISQILSPGPILHGHLKDLTAHVQTICKVLKWHTIVLSLKTNQMTEVENKYITDKRII